MANASDSGVPRQPEEPTPEQVRAEMTVCEPYSAGDLAAEFPDTSRWTIQRRLETLHEQGDVSRKKHTNNRVSWWIPATVDQD